MNSYAWFAVALVFLGCCSNVVFLELLIKNDPGAGNIITFSQFLFVALEGLVVTTKFLTVKNVVPIKQYMIMVCLFFTVSVVNNYALNFNIPMPLHMIFRAGSLMANMLLGVLILNRQYPCSKVMAVFMITVGISVSTIASAHQLQSQSSNGTQTSQDAEGTTSDEKQHEELIRLMIGIAMLLFAMFMSARLGIFQETLYSTYGKHPREAMFYSHALPLPGFLLLAPDLWQRVLIFSASDPILVWGIPIPKMWLYMLGNSATQYICIRGVFVLTTECPSLVVTLVITLRKFISLLFSIYYFQNPFTLYHWLGTTMVFGGTIIFVDLVPKIRDFFGEKPKPKTE
ncbi:UDP-xylose and UDP-N-acetylglucosamine transporter-like [Dysidea avara]|uniref:UDP-xylose and UDP-N-acetylglucosamine transporter-like n=1 Tax=Dysidea avara TaxID=196820 RepID=UPI003329F72C